MKSLKLIGVQTTGVDMVLDWITEKLDRKFVGAMERCHKENPDRKREITLLKRTVLVLMCLGLGTVAMLIMIKSAADGQRIYAMLG